ncbi:XkdX family protein [Bacillus sp. ISL-46]|nr:XkdX family protein [Bacillus sp. ISL-46]MBT2723041.1 XkdX family protein [Bacillus sp. ISL-46]
MLTYERIKRFYDGGLWTKDMVGNAVVKGIITTEQYEDITGEPYTM